MKVSGEWAISGMGKDAGHPCFKGLCPLRIVLYITAFLRLKWFFVP